MESETDEESDYSEGIWNIAKKRPFEKIKLDYISDEEDEDTIKKPCRLSTERNTTNFHIGAVDDSVERGKIREEKYRKYREALCAIKTAAPPVEKLQLISRYKQEYMVDRILCRNGNLFLVSWTGWNFTYSSYCTMEDLEHSSKLMELFVEYEKGMDAIYSNVSNTAWYSNNVKNDSRKPLFERQFVHKLKSVDDTVLLRLLSGSKSALTKELGPLKYWNVKRVELKWLQVLNPGLDFHYPPLYLESMTSDTVKVPEIEVCFSRSVIALEYFNQPLGKHMCVYKTSEELCPACKENNLARVTQEDPENLNNVTFPDNMNATSTLYMIMCSDYICSCPETSVDSNGQKKCRTWFSHYPRQDPLVVFYDKRYEGWGVRALTDIPKGRVVTEYLGDVHMEEELTGTDATYQMGGTIVTDCKFKGNESRFFGHSCQPNIGLIHVYPIGFSMEHMYRHVFVTLRDITAGADLTIDYHPYQQTKPPSGYAICKCDTPSCRGWL